MNSAKDYAAIFGSNFHAARLRAGLKIADVSERTGIDLGRISLIEHGGLEVTIQSMGLLAEAVGCPLSTLLVDGIEFVESDVEADRPT